MTTFIRLIEDAEKGPGMALATKAFRENNHDERNFVVEPNEFGSVHGAPFAYWVSDKIRSLFEKLSIFENDSRTAKVGLQTGDDFRFVRLWWEVRQIFGENKWFNFAKGGKFARFYADAYLTVNWDNAGAEITNFFDLASGKLQSRPQNIGYYFRPGLTWTNATTSPFSARALVKNCIFGHMGPSAFAVNVNELLPLLGLFNSLVFRYLGSLCLGLAEAGRKHYEVGLIQRTPVPHFTDESRAALTMLVRRAWSLKRSLDTVNETSHAFLLPTVIRDRVSEFQLTAIEAELDGIQQKIDDIMFELYDIDVEDRSAMERWEDNVKVTSSDTKIDADDDNYESLDNCSALFSWCVGVAFGRFDWRLATGERVPLPEPNPFDPLPEKSPGMLPDGAAPFHKNSGILVDDPGHQHDLVHWIEEILEVVEMPAQEDLRSWLQRDFFKLHLQQYSKSRRKAPIYWPLSTTSGSYTLWLYYPSLTNQTLYTAVNDFLDPKIKQVARDVANLRNKGSKRSPADEKQLDNLQVFELELLELRDTLLNIAPNYHPNHDDGVQITAAPLWQLFRHKPWQKVLKDTWAKLEKGDYDWSHLAMNYWPDRVREKCKVDKSLAIANGLEELYMKSAAASMKKTKK